MEDPEGGGGREVAQVEESAGLVVRSVCVAGWGVTAAMWRLTAAVLWWISRMLPIGFSTLSAGTQRWSHCPAPAPAPAAAKVLGSQ